MSDKLISMIHPLLYQTEKRERIFPAKMKSMRSNFYLRRRVLGKRLGNPNFEKITFKTLRHWKATMTYHRTKDILYVQKILGHKSLKNTLIYTHLVDFEEDENFTVKVARAVESLENHVQISFKDSGIGLSEEDIEKLFKPFPGIHHGLGVSSTGLGLAICKGIVDLHDGEIWVESDGPGTGSIFIVKIPVG